MKTLHSNIALRLSQLTRHAARRRALSLHQHAQKKDRSTQRVLVIGGLGRNGGTRHA